MTQFKNNKLIKLYYTDTDSIYTDSNIDLTMISEKTLGKLKLENVCSKTIFLAPKVYYLETEDGNIIYKVKGLSHNIPLNSNDFNNLLIKQSLLQKMQTKWIKNISMGHISIVNELYTLKVTDNKRKLIYINNKLNNTIPYSIRDKELKILNLKPLLKIL